MEPGEIKLSFDMMTVVTLWLQRCFGSCLLGKDFSLISFLKKSLAAPGGFAYFERSGRKAAEVKYISTFFK